MYEKLAVLASGKGTLLEAMIASGVPIALVLGERECRALDVAHEAHLPVELVERRTYGYAKGIRDAWDREGFTRAAMAALGSHKIDLIAMAGFATVLHPVFFGSYGGVTLNTHPALLPLHPGPGNLAVQQTIDDGDKTTGCTVHVAGSVVDDHRYIIAQQGGVPVLQGDTVDTLWERIKETERGLYARTIIEIMHGRLPILMGVKYLNFCPPMGVMSGIYQPTPHPSCDVCQLIFLPEDTLAVVRDRGDGPSTARTYVVHDDESCLSLLAGTLSN
jgi:phosphoribosylglycinamide formyltransferase-1